MNFQEIHSYYKTLSIFCDIVTTSKEGEAIIMAASWKWRPELISIFVRMFVININAIDDAEYW
jgi:hypothetical protein